MFSKRNFFKFRFFFVDLMTNIKTMKIKLFILFLSTVFILSCENIKPKIEKITPKKYKTIIAKTKSKKMVLFS